MAMRVSNNKQADVSEMSDKELVYLMKNWEENRVGDDVEREIIERFSRRCGEGIEWNGNAWLES